LEDAERAYSPAASGGARHVIDEVETNVPRTSVEPNLTTKQDVF